MDILYDNSIITDKDDPPALKKRRKNDNGIENISVTYHVLPVFPHILKLPPKLPMAHYVATTCHSQISNGTLKIEHLHERCYLRSP